MIINIIYKYNFQRVNAVRSEFFKINIYVNERGVSHFLEQIKHRMFCLLKNSNCGIQKFDEFLGFYRHIARHPKRGLCR